MAKLEKFPFATPFFAFFFQTLPMPAEASFLLLDLQAKKIFFYNKEPGKAL